MNPIQLTDLFEVINRINPLEYVNASNKNNDKEIYISNTLNFNNIYDEIYIKLIRYLIEGGFRENYNYDGIRSLLLEKINNFEEKSDNNTEISQKLRLLISDLGELYSLNSFYNKKREDGLIISNHKIYDKNEYRRIYLIGISVFKIDLLILGNSEDRKISEQDLIYFYTELSNLTGNQIIDYYSGILKEKIVFNLFKLSSVTGKKDYKYQYKFEDAVIEINNADKLFTNEKKIINYFTTFDTKYLSNNENIILQSLINGKFSSNIYLKILISIYKNKSDIKSMRNLYNEYKKISIKRQKEDPKYINFIYLGNNYLSLLIDSLKSNIGSGEFKKIKSEAKDLIKEIRKGQSNNNYINYFSYYKKSQYNLYCAKHYAAIHDFENAKHYMLNAKNDFKTCIKTINTSNNFEFFEFYDYENIIDLSNDTNNSLLSCIYCYNLYSLPFDVSMQRIKLDDYHQELVKEEVSLMYEKRIFASEEELKNNKTDMITLIGVFTGIAVFSFGTIQIFTFTENLGDTILVSGVLLSGILFLLGGIYYTVLPGIASNLKYNKGIYLFAIGLLVLSLSFLCKYKLYTENNPDNNINNEKIVDKNLRFNFKIFEGLNNI